jgi:hypothetical protein
MRGAAFRGEFEPSVPLVGGVGLSRAKGSGGDVDEAVSTLYAGPKVRIHLPPTRSPVRTWNRFLSMPNDRRRPKVFAPCGVRWRQWRSRSVHATRIWRG